jgi:hypothetical protein
MFKVKKFIAALMAAMTIFSMMSFSVGAEEWGPLIFIPGSPTPPTVITKSGYFTYAGYTLGTNPDYSVVYVDCTDFSPTPNPNNAYATVTCGTSTGTATFYSTSSFSLLRCNGLYVPGTRMSYYSSLHNYVGMYVEANGNIF